MMFVITFLLVASLEIAFANNDPKVEISVEETPKEEHDMCVGCEEKKEEKNKPPEELNVEVRIDPETGKVHYIIKGLVIEK